MQASIESFWQSITRQRRFLSCSDSVGWALR
uniref:Root phototropism protein 3 n=1 Tax=Rhizophora mucronata TaxID=61149 RepID=A0A2P2J145_RHIMU